MKRLLRIVNRALLGIISGVIIWLLELFIHDILYTPPITSTEDTAPVYIMGMVTIYLCLLLFNIVYCLVFAFINTKRNRWYLILLYILIVAGFYLTIL